MLLFLSYALLSFSLEDSRACWDLCIIIPCIAFFFFFFLAVFTSSVHSCWSCWFLILGPCLYSKTWEQRCVQLTAWNHNLRVVFTYVGIHQPIPYAMGLLSFTYKLPYKRNPALYGKSLVRVKLSIRVTCSVLMVCTGVHCLFYFIFLFHELFFYLSLILLCVFNLYIYRQIHTPFNFGSFQGAMNTFSEIYFK